MATVNRKITYRLYPNVTQTATLIAQRDLHCRVYNTCLEEKQRHHQLQLGPYGFKEMCKDLTGWRHAVPALAALNAQSLQVTAKRVDLAFQHFFRRVADGDTPGYPRFKSAQRFKGFGFKTHGDGWRVSLGDERHGHVRLAGVGLVKMRGRGRFQGAPKTAEVVCKHNRWYLSVTFVVGEVALRRTVPCDRSAAAFDWGLEHLLTLFGTHGLEVVENPRWLRQKLAALKTLHQAISAEQARLMCRAGLDPRAPIAKGTVLPTSAKLQRLRAQTRALLGKIARQRHDFYHQLTAALVRRFAAIATEELDIKAMVRRPAPIANPDGSFAPNGANQTKGLRRNIHDAAPSMLLDFLRYKAVEAGTVLDFADTKNLKPSQRCYVCHALVTKTLEERVHRCACGVVCGRDENAARILYHHFEASFSRPGTGLLKSPQAA